MEAYPNICERAFDDLSFRWLIDWFFRLCMSITLVQSNWLWKMICLRSFRIWLRREETGRVLEAKSWLNKWRLLSSKHFISTLSYEIQWRCQFLCISTICLWFVKFDFVLLLFCLYFFPLSFGLFAISFCSVSDRAIIFLFIEMWKVAIWLCQFFRICCTLVLLNDYVVNKVI